MTDLVKAGDLLVQEGTDAPGSLMHWSEPDSNGWSAVRDNRSRFEDAVHAAGWTFFFMAGEIKATVFGFDRQKTLRRALKRLITDVKSQRCNSIEITGVMSNSLLRVPYVSVSAHPRHLQKGTRFSG